MQGILASIDANRVCDCSGCFMGMAMCSSCFKAPTDSLSGSGREHGRLHPILRHADAPCRCLFIGVERKSSVAAKPTGLTQTDMCTPNVVLYSRVSAACCRNAANQYR